MSTHKEWNNIRDITQGKIPGLIISIDAFMVYIHLQSSHVLENILLLACLLFEIWFYNSKPLLACFFKSMVEYIKTITCFLFIYGLN